MCLAWVVGIGLGRAAEPATNDATALVTMQGTVEVSPAGTTNWIPARVNAPLRPGDRLRTGPASKALLRLSPLSSVPIGPSASLTLVAPATGGGSRSLIELLRGAIYFFHRDRAADSDFKTRLAAGAVRGTEFQLEVDDLGRTIVTVLDGEVELATANGPVRARNNERIVLEEGKPPARSAVLNAVNVIQWVLYYPAVLDPDELSLPLEAQTALGDSLAAYRAGDVPHALALYPVGRSPATPGETAFLAGLLLAGAEVTRAEALLDQPALAGDPRGIAVRALVAAVKLEGTELAPATNTASGALAETYQHQARADLDAALLAARRAVELSPGFAFGWARVAELEFGFGRVLEARAALEKSLAFAPRNAAAVTLKGFLLAARNRIPEALAAFDQAIELDGAIGNAWLGRGLCRIRHGALAAGREDLQIAAAREPQRALFRAYLGKAFDVAGNPARAAKELALARQLDPADPESWYYSALLLRQSGRINEAIQDLEQSAALTGNRSIYRSRLLLDQDRAARGANLAAIYEEAGMTDVAYREAARAVNFDYQNAAAHLFLANSYDALRDPNQVNLRYETPWLSEYLLANLLSPPGASVASPAISQQEYSRLFDRDGLGISSSTEYLSRGAWSQSGSQFGSYGGTSYALEHSYHNDPGQHPNADIETLTLSLRLKQQLTPADGLYFEALYYDANGGDGAQYYDPQAASQTFRFRENQEPILVAGLNHAWDPSSHTLVLVSRMQDRLRINDPAFPIAVVDRTALAPPTGLAFGTLPWTYTGELEIYSAEVQQLWETADHLTLVGARGQTGEFESQSRLDEVIPGTPPLRQNTSDDFNRFTAYAYHHWRLAPSLLAVGGLTYDHLVRPKNHRLPPLGAGSETLDQVSPKAGLVWTPGSNTVVRAAYARSLGGVSFDQTFQLEPTQVAGFNQAFRSLIPESISGAAAGTRFETAGISAQHQWPTRTYLGVTAEWSRSRLERELGDFDLVTGGGGFFTVPVASSLRQQLDYDERALTLTLNQLLGQEWAMGARYRLSDVTLDSRLPALTSANSNESTSHQFDGFVIYQSASGCFARLDSVWTAQSNRGYAPDQPGDDFWQFHAQAGYRFARRRAEISVGVLNLTDQDWRLNPLGLAAEPPRERTLVVSCRFSF